MRANVTRPVVLQATPRSILSHPICKGEGSPQLGGSMSILTRFAPESLTSDQYDEVVRRLNEENISPADGLDYPATR